MTTYQTGRGIAVNYYVESVFNTPPGAGTSNRFRANASGGLKLARALINPNEIRVDGMTSMGRLGSKSIAGSYSADASVGTFDPLLEAALRGTWTAAVAITEATAGLTSITTGTSTIVAAAGSWLTAGVRVGDVVRLTGHSTAANNSRNLRVTGVSALTLTVAETLVADAVADTAFTLTIARKLVMPAVPVRRSFTFEQYGVDTDLTEQFTGCRVSSLRVTGQPDGMCILEFGIVGADLNPLATGASPYYTSPTVTSTIALTLADATIRLGGADIAVLTSFEYMHDLRAATLPVIGSTLTPDVFENPAQGSGSVSGVRSDFTNLNRFKNETELELHVLMVEPESEPKDFISLFLPQIKLTGTDTGFGGDGALIETMPFIVGPKDGASATGYNNSMVVLATSAT